MSANTTLTKGETRQFSVKFPSNLTETPSWTLFDEDDTLVFSGVASLGSDGRWNATITVPTTTRLNNGEETWTLEFEATTTANRQLARQIELTVHDNVDTWRAFGLSFRPNASSLDDIVVYPDQPSRISILLRDGYDAGNMNIASTILTNPSPLSSTSNGYAYRISLPLSGVSLSTQSGGYYPYQFEVTAGFPTAPDDVNVKPVYLMTPSVITQVISLKRYLDKARLDEIDPNLQWGDEELVHFLMEGVQYINSVKDLSFWTIANIPPPLYSPLLMSAAWHALNARFIAEGMVNFDFQGSNTQLSFNRRDAIQTKMDELRSVLDNNLIPTKTAAFRTYGPGVAPPGINGATQKAIGSLGVAYTPNLNRTYFRIGQKRYGLA